MGLFFQLTLCFLLTSPAARLSTSTVAVPHPFYVAVTEITQNSTDKSLEISCRFFVDDFEKTLEKAFKTSLDMNAAKDKDRFDNLIPEYINSRLAIAMDGRPLKLSYIGFEKDKESVYCYFEVVQAPAVKQLQVVNSLLHDFTNEQINIVHVTVNGKRQSAKLDFPNSKASFQF
jgi:hypothetical protein